MAEVTKVNIQKLADETLKQQPLPPALREANKNKKKIPPAFLND